MVTLSASSRFVDLPRFPGESCECALVSGEPGVRSIPEKVSPGIYSIGFNQSSDESGSRFSGSEKVARL